MENASKALIIAGSILIAILLIGIGVKIFNSQRGTTEQVGSTMSATEVAMFNNKFLNYIGSGKTFSQVSTLYSVVLNNNANNYAMEVEIKYNGATIVINNLDVSKKYKILVAEHTNDGRIKVIEVSDDN